MSTKRSCYQCGDEDIEAIREARNEQIRAYGRQILVDADAKFAAEQAASAPAPSEIDDWAIVDEAVEEQPVVEPVEIEKVDADVLAATEPQETTELQAKVDESPKPEEQANDGDKQNVEVATELTAAEGAEALKAEQEAAEKKAAAKAAKEAKAAKTASSKEATDSK